MNREEIILLGMELVPEALSDIEDEARDDELSQFLLFDEDGDFTARADMCTACLDKVSGYDYVMSLTTSSIHDRRKETRRFCSDTIVKKYIDWLIHESPYSDVILSTNVDEVLETGMVVDTHNPSNLVIEALIAHRMVSEQLGLIRSWDYLVSRGIKPALAWIFAHMFYYSKSKKTFYYYDNNHIGVLKTLDVNYLTNFYDGSVVNRSDEAYNGFIREYVQETWGDGKSLRFFDFVEDCYTKSKTKTGTNPFTGEPVYRTKISLTKVVNKLKKIQEKVLCVA